MWNCMPSMQKCRLTVTTHTRSYTLLIVCWLYQAKSTLICIPRALLCLQWLMALFLYFILSTILSLSILLFPIACSFWFRENCQAYTIESFLFSPLFFLFALHIAPCCPTHSHLFPFCTPLHQNCPSWQKGRQGFHRQGWRRARRKSINFTPGAAASSVFFCGSPPHSFGPLKSDPDPPQEACKTVKTNLQKVVLLLSSCLS